MFVKFSTLTKIKQNYFSFLNAVLERTKFSKAIRTNLNIFQANSGNWSRFRNVSLQSANQFPIQLNLLLGTKELMNFFEVFKSFDIRKQFESLEESFGMRGSDKGAHGYHKAYGHILESLSPKPSILEIGVGTNAPGSISSMGAFGTPGASLYSWRDILPDSSIIGCDVEPTALVESDSFTCIHLDQLNLESWTSLKEFVGELSQDLIIDDGLHTTEANINTLIFAQYALRPDGWLVIEDVKDETIVIWNILSNLEFFRNLTFSRFRGDSNNLVIARKSPT